MKCFALPFIAWTLLFSYQTLTVNGESVRIASFNASLYSRELGGLAPRLAEPGDPQIAAVAEIIQRVRPDVLLINEFDFDPTGQLIDDLRKNYLSIAQHSSASPEGPASPIEFPYVFLAPSNTGLHSGHDLDRNGQLSSAPGTSEYGGDCWGYGEYPGKYAMVLLSKYPIDSENARTFQHFRWRDMPDALLPDNPDTPSPADWYSTSALQDFPLSSKSHWDVPITIADCTVHILASHPTPPTYDGEEDRNGRRNHDEIRFWVDYITPDAGKYIYDDKGKRGGLTRDALFVVAGDLNGDPIDGDGKSGILRLLRSPLVSASPAPKSDGAAQQAELQAGANLSHRGDPSFDTLDAADEDGPGNLRVDYVIPARSLQTIASGVFWPKNDDWRFRLVGTHPFPSSDHRLVWIDVSVESPSADE